MLKVLQSFDLDLVAVAEVNKEFCFFAPIFALGENLSFFLMADDIDDFKPILGRRGV